jgi:hypothetical protein
MITVAAQKRGLKRHEISSSEEELDTDVVEGDNFLKDDSDPELDIHVVEEDDSLPKDDSNCELEIHVIEEDGIFSIDDNDTVHDLHDLRTIWKSLSQPHAEADLFGKWYAVVYQDKSKKTSRKKCSKKTQELLIAKITNRFLEDEGGPVEKIRMRCLKPKVGSVTVLDDTPVHLPDDNCDFDLKNIIASPLQVFPKVFHQFVVPDYKNVILPIDRDTITM